MAITVPTSAKNGSGTWNGSDIGQLTNIGFDMAQDLEVYASSSTAGQRTRTAGHQDSSGQFTMLLPPPMARGDQGTLVLYYADGEEAYNGPAIIGNTSPGIDINAGTNIQWVISWGQKPDAELSS